MKSNEIKKCAVESCDKPAVGKIPTTIVENDKVMSGYMYYCEEHLNPVIKEVLSLRSRKGMVNIITSKEGKIGLTVRNYTENAKADVTLSDEEVKAIIKFLKKALF